MITAGIVITGSRSRTPVVNSPIAVSAEATTAAGWPFWIRILPWTTLPVAGPPGTTLLAALPASWAVARVPQPARGTISPSAGAPSSGSCWANASRASHHRDAMLHASRATSTANQPGFTSTSRGQDPNSDSRLGATMYRPIPVMVSPTARPPQRRTRALPETAMPLLAVRRR